MKMTKIVEVSLNGDAPNVDSAIRRTLYAMAAQDDETTEDMLAEVRGVKKLLLTLTGTVVTGILISAVNILLAM